MVILHDFEALTQNILCRVIETVAGSGMIIFLLGLMPLLQNVFNLNMEVHSKFKTILYKVLILPN